MNLTQNEDVFWNIAKLLYTKTVFILIIAEKIWAPRHLDVSVPCMLWVAVDAEQTEPELLVSAGSDKRLRVWKREKGEGGTLVGLEMFGMFGVQPAVILALAQNSTYLATASGEWYWLSVAWAQTRDSAHSTEWTCVSSLALCFETVVSSSWKGNYSVRWGAMDRTNAAVCFKKHTLQVQKTKRW